MHLKPSQPKISLLCDKRTRFSCTLQWVFDMAHPFRMPLKQEVRFKKLFPNLPLKTTSLPHPLSPGVTGRAQFKLRGLGSAISLQVTAHTSPVPPYFRMLWSKWARLRQVINRGWKETGSKSHSQHKPVSRECGECLRADAVRAEAAALTQSVPVEASALPQLTKDDSSCA